MILKFHPYTYWSMRKNERLGIKNNLNKIVRSTIEFSAPKLRVSQSRTLVRPSVVQVWTAQPIVCAQKKPDTPRPPPNNGLHSSEDGKEIILIETIIYAAFTFLHFENSEPNIQATTSSSLLKNWPQNIFRMIYICRILGSHLSTLTFL